MLIDDEGTSHAGRSVVLARNTQPQAVALSAYSPQIVQSAVTGAAIELPAILTRSRPRAKGWGPGERKLVQAAIDLTIIVGGSLALVLWTDDDSLGPSIMGGFWVVCGLWFFFASAFDAYSIQTIQSRFRSPYFAAKAFLATGVAYILIATFLGGVLPVHRFHLTEYVAGLLLLCPLMLVRRVFSTFLQRDPLRRHIVIVGANSSGFEMATALMRYGGTTYRFLGYFDEPDSVDGGPTEGDVLSQADLFALHEDVGIDQIVLANPRQSSTLLEVLSVCHEQGIQVTPMFALYQDLAGRVPVSHLDREWYVGLPAHVRSTDRVYIALKRIFDVLMSLTMLVAAAPFLPLIALIIKLDSPGPILFKQVRMGQGGRLFSIVKFRSMSQDAEVATGAVWARDADPRVTRVGRFLRKSRLDEIPQLWNVLVGDMSMVGPRPERPEFEDKLRDEIPFYRARRAVRPGLTGWAQVQHGYGNTMHDTLLKVEYDLYYVKNQSVYLDLMIMLRTVAVVLKLSGT